MIYLAKYKERTCSLREISEKEDIPFNFLEKIILKLEKASLVRAKKGVNGGYFLAKNLKEIKIYQIIKSLDGKINLVNCLSNFCPRSDKCLARGFWQKINKIISSALNSVSLADLIKK